MSYTIFQDYMAVRKLIRERDSINRHLDVQLEAIKKIKVKQDKFNLEMKYNVYQFTTRIHLLNERYKTIDPKDYDKVFGVNSESHIEIREILNLPPLSNTAITDETEPSNS